MQLLLRDSPVVIDSSFRGLDGNASVVEASGFDSFDWGTSIDGVDYNYVFLGPSRSEKLDV